MANETTVAPSPGIVIEYMDETTNQRHVEKHTTARTVADFIRIEKLDENAVVSVEGVIASADGSTAINEGNTVSVVTGNKTGGDNVGTRKTKVVKNRGFEVINLLSTNELYKKPEHREVCTTKTLHRGKIQKFTILEGLPMPTRMLKPSKYPFHLLEIGQCFNVPVSQRLTISAAMRSYMKKNQDIVLEGRTHVLGQDVLFGIWRTTPTV